MSETIDFKISIEELFPKLANHLNIENNSRIFFSGKFGIGKTYFLNEFFEKNKDKYEVFHLYPANYQISSNDDVIEFIKYDILTKLFKKDGTTNNKKDPVNLKQIAKSWGKENIFKIIKTGLSFVPRLGNSLGDTTDLVESFLKFKKDIESGDTGNVDEFIRSKDNSILSETDVLSEIIKNKINEKKIDKKSVLILDDLERIDPEHIFRILNIFSCFFSDEHKNKFGFDQMILVSDIQNIKHIFHHKYGPETDFNGYIDKFFSVEVFQFNNEDLIEKTIDDIISAFKIEDKNNLEGAMGSSGYIRIPLKLVLSRAIKLPGKDKLNLRQLLKGIKFPLDTFRNGSYKNGIMNEKQIILQLINLTIKALISIFGGQVDNFENVLSKIKLLVSGDIKHERVLKEFSSVVLSKIKKTNMNGPHERLYGEMRIRMEDDVIIKVMSATGEAVNIENFFIGLLIDYTKKNLYLEEINI